jgi:phosphatidylinositol alpha-1,6-mannosyltransferase
MKKRLALVCGNLLSSPHGGIPTVNRQMLRQIVRRSSRREVEVDVWVLHDEPASEEQVARFVGLPLRSFRYFQFSGSKARMLGAATLARRPDVVVTTHLYLAPVALVLRGLRGRVYQFLHGIECWSPPATPTRESLRAVDELVSNSGFTLRRALETIPILRDLPAHVCHLGVPEERWAPAASDSPPVGPPSVLITARLSRSEGYKGHADLLAIWPDVVRAVPGARLDVVGTGDAEPDLRARARELGLGEDSFKLWGRVADEELRERYRACRAFAMPSRGEGFGLVYLEAMSFAKPCIASLDDAAVEVVVDGETGLLVRYGDRPALLDAVVRLLRDPELAARLGRAGRARLDARFREDDFGERLVAALAERSGLRFGAPERAA